MCTGRARGRGRGCGARGLAGAGGCVQTRRLPGARGRRRHRGALGAPVTRAPRAGPDRLPQTLHGARRATARAGPRGAGQGRRTHGASQVKISFFRSASLCGRASAMTAAVRRAALRSRGALVRFPQRAGTLLLPPSYRPLPPLTRSALASSRRCRADSRPPAVAASGCPGVGAALRTHGRLRAASHRPLPRPMPYPSAALHHRPEQPAKLLECEQERFVVLCYFFLIECGAS